MSWGTRVPFTCQLGHPGSVRFVLCVGDSCCHSRWDVWAKSRVKERVTTPPCRFLLRGCAPDATDPQRSSQVPLARPGPLGLPTQSTAAGRDSHRNCHSTVGWERPIPPLCTQPWEEQEPSKNISVSSREAGRRRGLGQTQQYLLPFLVLLSFCLFA